MLSRAWKPLNAPFYTIRTCSSSLSRIQPPLIVIFLFCHKAFAACVAVARIYKAQTRCRSCSRWRLVYTDTVAWWQLMTHESGQVKLPPPNTKCSTTTSEDYQRNDRNMQEMHLQTFSDFLWNLHSKNRKDIRSPEAPSRQGRRKAGPPCGHRVVPVTEMGQVPRNISHLYVTISMHRNSNCTDTLKNAKCNRKH